MIVSPLPQNPMPIVPLPKKIAQLSHEIETLKKSILHLEAPIETPPTAAAGSLLATMTATMATIGDSEQVERSRLVKVGAMRDLLIDAELTLKELQRQQARSKPLYDAGLIRLEKSRKNFNGAIDAVLSSWDEFQASLKSISDDASTQTGAAPYSRTEYPMDNDWLSQVGKIAPMNAQNYFPVIRAYEFDRIHTDGE